MQPNVTVGVGPIALGDDERVLALPVAPGEPPVVAAGLASLDRLGLDAAALLAARRVRGDAGEVVDVPVARDGVDTVLLVGIGDGSAPALRKAAAACARRAGAGASLVSALVYDAPADVVAAAAEATVLAGYAFGGARSQPPERPALSCRFVVSASAAVAEVEFALASAAAVCLARDLASTPSLEKTPQWMVEQARLLASSSSSSGSLSVTVWDEKQLAAEGFGGIVAVGRGSARPPRLVRLDYSPARPVGGRVVLVGKGITFDSGGLSLKPLDGMKLMKTDMSGAAAVLATMSALSRVGVRRPVTALLPLAENLPGADAMRPGDVLRHYGGRTAEVLNTDAEGRLVLADALSYAVAELAPSVVIDLATLTGAATLGLGKRHAALYSTSSSLCSSLVAAGAAGGERLWPMPLVDEYRDSLESPVADLRNVGDPDFSYSGGSIVAALFLREFVGDVAWAHLDIAGPARADGDEDEVTKGPTGFGVRTLLRYLVS